MVKNASNKLNASLSLLGFGAMRLPLGPDGKIDFAEGKKMVDLAHGAGVNYYDTAYVYHNGESERFLKEVLVSKYPRESFYLADKLPVWFCKNESDAAKIFADQQKRLGTEYIDFYLIHSLNADNWQTAIRVGALKLLDGYKRAGIIGRLGFSYHGDRKTFIDILDAYDWDFVQLQFNYIDYIKHDAKSYYEELEKREIPCVVMEPLRGGFLTRLPGEVLSAMEETDNSRSAELAFRWVAGFKNVAVILSGMSDLRQTEENTRLFANIEPLGKKGQHKLAKARAAVLNIHTIPCTMCGYCMDCPQHVHIAEIFSLYNDFKLYCNTFNFLKSYDEFGEKPRVKCTGCGSCKPRCPQGIEIPEWLAKIENERAATSL